MRILTAILLLAAALPTYAQTNGEYSVRFLNLETSGDRRYVQEYDGRHSGSLEADVEFSGLGSETYVDFGGYGLNGPNAGGYFDMNIGPRLAVKGKFSKLTHRVPVAKTGVIMNGRFVSPLGRNVDIYATLIPQTTDYTQDARVQFDRTEAEARVVYSLPNYNDSKLTAGIWQEDEIGTMPGRYSQNVDQATAIDVNRQTRDLSLGLNSGIGDGAFSAEYTQRNFSDSAKMTVSSTGVDGSLIKVDKPQIPSHVMNLYDIRFRTGAGKAIPVTGALTARTRTSGHNKYTGSAYSATVGASYKPAKKLSLSARAYSRVAGIYENQSFVDDKGKAWGTSGGPEAQINHSNLAGDLKAHYEFSDKLSFNGGYKYENNYRKNAQHYEEEFTGQATYQDGTFISSNTQSNAVAVQDTKQTMTVGLSAMLPFDAELEAGYMKMTANHAVFESLATDQNLGEVSLNLPLPASLNLMASASYLDEKNEKSNLTDSTLHQNSYFGGLDWAGSSRFSAGIDYAYEQASYRSTGYFGAANNVTGTVQVTNLLREPGMLYRYENNVYGYHARVKLDKEFSLTGRGSYTVSRGANPVNLNTFRGTTSVTVTNLAPMDIRIASGGFTLKYAPVAYKDITASLGYRRDMYLDKVVTANSGSVNTMNVALSAKF